MAKLINLVENNQRLYDQHKHERDVLKNWLEQAESKISDRSYYIYRFGQNSYNDACQEIGRQQQRLENLNTWLEKNDPYEYGKCMDIPTRRHKLNKNVQILMWKKGDQKHVDGKGHTEDKWIDMDKSWWDSFSPLK